MYLNFTIAMTVITIVAIALRFWSRLLGPTDRAQAFGRFWWDDWFALLALVCLFPFNPGQHQLILDSR